jgi:predicted aconitase with swiveling domain
MSAATSFLVHGRCIAPGKIAAEAVVCKTRISFWGGYDPASGRVTEKGNPLEGVSLDHKIAFFVSTKGSSGTANCLNLAKRYGTQPAAFVNTELDSLAVIGCLVNGIPMMSDLDRDPFESIKTGDWIEMDAEAGIIKVTSK